MAKSSEDLTRMLEKAMKNIADESKRTDDYWKDVGKVIEQTTKTFDRGFLKAASSVTGIGPVVQNVGRAMASAITGSDKHLEALRQKYRDLNLVRKQSTDPTDRLNMARQMDQITREAAAFKVLAKDVGEVINGKWGLAAVAFVGQLVLAFRYSKEINQQLIQTSADYANRARLAREISRVQAATGNEMADMAKAGAALANYGFDVRDSFGDTLTTVVKMEEGLGVSYETSAQLAVSSKRIGANFKDIASSVARIKADTALSAEEATKFATQISKAVMMLKPGSGGLVAQTSDYISRVAAALKELTGNGQGFVDMLASFTTESGMLGAATLGAMPDFLASPEQTKLVTERFVKYVNQQLSGTSGFQRMATIQLLAEQFNTSADVIANADEMLKLYNSTRKTATSLDEEWRKQTAEFSKTLSKIGNSLSAIVQQSLIPIIRYLNPVLEFMARGIQYVASSGAALYLGLGALAVSTLGAVVSITRLTAAISRFAITSGLAGNVSAAGGAAGLAGSSVGWLARISSILTRISAIITGPVAMVAAAGLAGAAVGLAADKYILKGLFGLDIGKSVGEALSKKDLYQAQVAAMRSGSMTRDDLLRNVSAMAGSGKSAQEIQDYISRNINKIKGLHGGSLDAQRRAQIVADTLGMAGREVTRQRVRMGYARQLTESTAEDRAYDAQMMELFKAIALNTQLANKLSNQVESREQLDKQKEALLHEEAFGEQRLQRQSIDSQSRVNNISSGPFFMPLPSRR